MRINQNNNEFNLDSLMDILTATVGIVIIIVLFAFLSAKGKMTSKSINIKISTPMLRQSTQNISPHKILCFEGHLYNFNSADILNKIGRFSSPEELVRSFNRAHHSDNFFNYSLKYIPGYSEPVIIVVIEKKANCESYYDLDTQRGVNNFLNDIRKRNMDIKWIHFLVDEKSVDIYNKARQLILAQNWTTGWDPISISFPYEECIYGSSTTKRKLIRGPNVIGGN